MTFPRFGPCIVALFLLLLTHLGVHYYVDLANIDKVYWKNGVNPDSLILQRKAFLNNQYLPMYGSSEFSYLSDTYHPARMFGLNNAGFKPFVAAAAGNTCLIQVQNLASLENLPSGKKTVIILSMQWFGKSGLAEGAFDRWFSTLKIYEIVFNPHISDDLKQQIAQRMMQFTAVKEDMLLYATLGTCNDPHSLKSFVIRIVGRCRMYLLQEEDYLHAFGILWNSRNAKPPNIISSGFTNSDWKHYHNDADMMSAQKNTNNPFGMMDDLYEKRFQKQATKIKEGNEQARQGPINDNKQNTASLKSTQDSPGKEAWVTSPEFTDLELLTKILRELGSDTLFVIQPGNGYWYDYTGLPQEQRATGYAKAHRIITGAGLKVADFSDHEYDKNFLVDASHPGWKGWCYIDEAIYRFYANPME